MRITLYGDDDEPFECNDCGEILEFDEYESKRLGKKIYTCMACGLMHTSDGETLEDDDEGDDA